MTRPRQTESAPAGPRALGSLELERAAAIEVLATDVDGTLTESGKLGAELVAALAGLADHGLAIIPISGRPAGEVLGLCRYLPGVRFGVAENGLLEIEPDVAPRWLDDEPDLAKLVAVGERLNASHGAGLRRTGDAFVVSATSPMSAMGARWRSSSGCGSWPRPRGCT